MNTTKNVFVIMCEHMNYIFIMKFTINIRVIVIGKVTPLVIFGCLPLSNKLVHALVGNKTKGYHVAVWNCARGLILPDCTTSDKLVDIKLYLEKHQLDLFGILECDLHSEASRCHRKSKLTTHDIKQKLSIEGYKLILPQSWLQHGQARIILYAKDSINVYEIGLENNDSDLASISVAISKGNEKKTNIYKYFIYLYFYSYTLTSINCKVQLGMY